MTIIIYPYLNCYASELLWGADAICPIGIFQNSVINNLIPFYLIGFTIVVGVFFGRTFCGWACPIGFVQDIITKIKEKGLSNVNPGKKISMREELHRKMIHVKFLLLFLTIIVAYIFRDTIFCKICPAATFEAAIPHKITYGTEWTMIIVTRTVVLISLIGAVILISRFWCRYLCPFGAMIAPFNRLAYLQIYFDSEKCNECGVCLEDCPMNIKFLEDKPKYLYDFECIRCGICVDACRKGAIKFVTKT
ncbi:MAG: 4Fe-4S binding protein [Candidatus Hydrothermarchaeota archaeon]